MMDALDLYDRHERDRERQLEERPMCSNCQEHIQDERAFYNDGEWICLDCLKRDFIRDVEDFVG